jgi:PAS domain-containing protein
MGIDLYKGQSVFDLSQDSRKELLKTVYAEVLSGKQHETEIEIKIPGKGVRLIHTIFRPAKNEKGQIIGVIILSDDKTEQRKKEFEIKESNNNLQLLLGNTDEAFIMINRDFEVLLFNNKAATIIQDLFEKKLHKGEKFLELATVNRKDVN